MITCPKCGKENQDHYKFCLGCGNELPRDGGGGGAKPYNPTPPAGVPAVRAPAAGGPFGGGPAQPAGGPFGGGSAGPFGGGAPPQQQPPPPAVGPFGGGGFQPVAPPVAAPFGGAPQPAAAGPKFAAVCQQCSTPNPGQKRFCLTCGFDLTLPESTAMSAAAAVPQSPPPPVAAPVFVPQPPPVVQAPPPPVMAPIAQPPVAASRARLVLIRPDGTEGGTYPLNDGVTQIGRNTGPLFAQDAYMSPQHATFTINGMTVGVRDDNSLNGVYVRVGKQVPVEIAHNDLFRVGQEILRYEAYGPVQPEPDGTERQGAQIEGLMGRISLVVGRETTGNAFPLPSTGLFLGRERGDILFPEDGYVSGLHAQLSYEGNKLMLTDLNSSNGTYVRIRSERVLQNGDLLLMGQQLFRLGIG